MSHLQPIGTPARRAHLSQQATPSSVRQANSNATQVASSSKTIKFSNDARNHGPPSFGITPIAGNIAVNRNERSTLASMSAATVSDPFLNGTSQLTTRNTTRLSPTAPPFLPQQGSRSGTQARGLEVRSQQVAQDTPSGSSAISGHTLKGAGSPGKTPKVEGIFSYYYPTGEFTHGRFTRYLKITGMVDNNSPETLNKLLRGATHGPPQITAKSCVEKALLLGYSSIVDSVNACGEISANHRSLKVDFVNAKQFAAGVRPGTEHQVSIHKGQLLLVAIRIGAATEVDRYEILECVLELIKNYGLVLAWDVLDAVHPAIRIHMEYYDIADSERAKAMLDGVKYGPFHLHVKDYAPDLQEGPSGPLVLPPSENDFVSMVNKLTFSPPFASNLPIIRGSDNRGYISPGIMSSASDGTVTASNYLQHRGTPIAPANSLFGMIAQDPPRQGPSSMDVGALGMTPLSELVMPTEHHMATYRGDIHGRRAARMLVPGNHNAVNFGRILGGGDVRSTIMLRNIPNKMSQPELKALVDSTSFGQYDFMYLRIDFANNCNVGYAFINFVRPMEIAKFIRARSGIKWPGYKSDKMAEISYATIQGRDCLIQKFRNSSVMLEEPDFRPKLYYTLDSPRAGEEESFPPSDNQSKLNRSIENAGAVGLYAPKAGQHFREQQRNRRSQFDRGTQSAAYEEYVDQGFNDFQGNQLGYGHHGQHHGGQGQQRRIGNHHGQEYSRRPHGYLNGQIDENYAGLQPSQFDGHRNNGYGPHGPNLAGSSGFAGYRH